MLANFGFGNILGKAQQQSNDTKAKLILTLGVSLNLSVLGYFKYADFFVTNLNVAIGTHFDFADIALPLAISFFTFQQIAFLVDSYKGITQEYRFSHYALFVTFFPQLIAGPIVHHKEMLPQFIRKESLKPHINNIVIGLTIFFFGLFKKVILADGVAQYATPVFNAAANGGTPSFFVAWGGALAYTMQLYFDFSGYSDMAIGSARTFGIRLPLNFHSPYKATSIAEFWRRWHITLSRFLRNYVYIAMGGNRRGETRRYFNLLATMLIGGLWHGAGWTFVVWGGLHGLYLVINHLWNKLQVLLSLSHLTYSRLYKMFAWLLTFLAVVVGWVFFRAIDFDSALVILEGMAGFNGVALPNGLLARLGSAGEWLKTAGVSVDLGGGAILVFTYLWVTILAIVAFVMPNTQQIMSRFNPVLYLYKSEEKHEIRFRNRCFDRLLWRPSIGWLVIMAVVTGMSILALASVSEFLYFQF